MGLPWGLRVNTYDLRLAHVWLIPTNASWWTSVEAMGVKLWLFLPQPLLTVPFWVGLRILIVGWWWVTFNSLSSPKHAEKNHLMELNLYNEQEADIKNKFNFFFLFISLHVFSCEKSEKVFSCAALVFFFDMKPSLCTQIDYYYLNGSLWSVFFIITFRNKVSAETTRCFTAH